ncbi:MAG TPA: 5'-nucleotidase, lipoprotein e(P4) family [Ginsengibacter sp.]
MNIKSARRTKSESAVARGKYRYIRMIKLLFFFVCAINYVQAQDTTGMATVRPFNENDLKTFPVLWQQTAAEYRALCYQAFNVAELRVNEIPEQDFKNKKLAIVTDLDETILDNSFIAAYKIVNGKDINYKAWKKWIDQPVVPTVPGAVQFLQYAASKGITIFYISNRDVKGMNATLYLLAKLKLPDADTSHILLLTDNYSKEERRKYVSKDYDVIMLLGDNLNDFTQIFEDKPIDKRLSETDKARDDWGKKFIVLPNSTYGDWESALYNYQSDLSPAQEDAIRLQLLKNAK